MKPLYIFDLDGTLANIDHRQWLLDCKDNPKRWDQFFDACDKDSPVAPVIRTLELLRFSADIFIWSGRSIAVRDKTARWLTDHTSFMTHDLDVVLRMRPAGDFTPDDELKGGWLEELSGHDRRRLVAIFDDRDKVVAMWRAKDIPCFQVAEGKF